MKKNIIEFMADYLNCQQVKVKHQKLGGMTQEISYSYFRHMFASYASTTWFDIGNCRPND